VHRDGERLGGREALAELAVHEECPHVAEGDLAGEVLDVHPAVTQRAAVAVGFGDLGAEGDDALQPGPEAVVRLRLHR
jgi:hypothetical protein